MTRWTGAPTGDSKSPAFCRKHGQRAEVKTSGDRPVCSTNRCPVPTFRRETRSLARHPRSIVGSRHEFCPAPCPLSRLPESGFFWPRCAVPANLHEIPMDSCPNNGCKWRRTRWKTKVALETGRGYIQYDEILWICCSTLQTYSSFERFQNSTLFRKEYENKEEICGPMPFTLTQ